jgi:carbamoyl-phosphate synthase large subunit
MPRRNNIYNVMIIGSGPIRIGQGCEFDYSGVQACHVLKEEGYRVVLVNSNPATIMTDPDVADATYIEPLEKETIKQILLKESVDAILTTMGGQTAINLSISLEQEGFLDRHDIKLLGADSEVIQRAEERSTFYHLLEKHGIPCPQGISVSSLAEGKKAIESLSLPIIMRSSYCLGGSGVTIARDKESFEKTLADLLCFRTGSPILLEESVEGWKEFELEVVRDKNDNCILVCSIENCDPMGIHTGDSITVAPALTLSDKELQKMRLIAFQVMRLVGVETGGANVQFAVNPDDGRMLVIEMNPRVSRSSALASKATGFPIAKVAAKLAVGYTLDELSNSMTSGLTAAFEPTIDYVVTKIPRFDFEKFSAADQTLTTTMKSVGEVMGIGKSFQESLLKAIYSLEKEYDQLGPDNIRNSDCLLQSLQVPSEKTVFNIAEAFCVGIETEKISKLTGWDKWFLERIQHLIELERKVSECGINIIQNLDLLLKCKANGFSNQALSKLSLAPVEEIETALKCANILPVFRRIDACAGEFPTENHYFYSTYLYSNVGYNLCEAEPTSCEKVIIIGSGPNHVGQGIEFDYMCVRAADALKSLGFETIMINCNPETVSTDHVTSDRLYFTPITSEHVLDIIKKERTKGTLRGVFLQFGGQASLKLAEPLNREGIPILGSSFDSIESAENRNCTKKLINESDGLDQPENFACYDEKDFIKAVQSFQGLVIVRPSYVIGGRYMKIIETKDPEILREEFTSVPKNLPILVEEFLRDFIEVDVDAVAYESDIIILGVTEQLEMAGIHSGDSTCVFPPQNLSWSQLEFLHSATRAICSSTSTLGLVNIQFAVKGELFYVLEINPRASRTVPFLSKARGLDAVRLAVEASLRIEKFGNYKSYNEVSNCIVAIKKPIFSHKSLGCSCTYLSPEMKSTGEVMCSGESYTEAYYKIKYPAFTMALEEFSEATIIIQDNHELEQFFTNYLISRNMLIHNFSRHTENNNACQNELHRVRSSNPKILISNLNIFSLEINPISDHFWITSERELDALRAILKAECRPQIRTLQTQGKIKKLVT